MRCRDDISIYTVAEQAGVSAATVSRVINRRGGVGADTVKRVQQAIAASGFQPRWRATSAPAIGMLMVQGPGVVSNPYGAALLSGATEACFAAGTALTLMPFRGLAASADEVARLVDDHRLDGVLVIAMHQMYSLPDRLGTRGVPQVVIGQLPNGCAGDVIASDDRSAGARAAGHLRDLGHRRIAVVTASLSDRGHADRLAGIRDVLPGPDAVVVCERRHVDIEAGIAAGLELLAATPRPTVIMATNSVLAQGVLRACRMLRLAVPGDIALLGFEDSDELAGTDPPITALHQDAQRLGRRAAEVLLARVAGALVPDAWLAPLQHGLVVRASTMPAGTGPGQEG